MEDLFYFSQDALQLQDIVALCDVVGLDKAAIGEGVANTYYQGDDFWQWFELEEEEGDYEDFSAELLAEVARFKPKTAISVAHCVASIPKLKKVLANILAKHGGWLSYDLAEGFVRYEAAELGELQHSGYS